MYFLYTLLYALALFFLFPREYLKRKKGQRRQWLKEKFAWIEKPQFEKKAPVLWIHAVSVGEVLAISSLIKALSQHYNIVLTTITDTGKEVASKTFQEPSVKILYLPFDFRSLIKRFLHKIEAKALFLTETELWPNLILEASSSIPVALINGRVSEKSFKRYKMIKFFIKPLLERMSFLAVQEELYAERLEKLGAPSEKIKVVGNLKFDLQVKEIEFPELAHLNRPILIAGSTHPSEEEIILKAFQETISKGTLIFVPRHPERFDEVEKLLLSLKKREDLVLRYSQLKRALPSFEAQRCLLLFDEMGKLSALYRICDLAIIGGSFIPHGGQNPLEALYWKKPVITGPHMENFPFVKEFVASFGLLQVTPEKLASALRELIEKPQKAKLLAENGHNLLFTKRGALEKTLRLIRELIAL